MVDSNLIFDIGLHKGMDAQFYLRKGFNVVGIEASPDLCHEAAANNKEYIADGRLAILQKALFYRSGETVKFFMNPEKDDWGSLFRGATEQGVGTSYEIEVETITLAEVFSAYGVPYYIKCDVEGGDSIFIEQLLLSQHRPNFVSIEATSADDIAILRACGYNRFQLVNQYMNPFTKAPQPAREGVYVESAFSHVTSGLFGRELPESGWIDFTKVIHTFLDWYSVRERNPLLVVGWLDIHACRM
jgi:FkbM family methyltransferase